MANYQEIRVTLTKYKVKQFKICSKKQDRNNIENK